MTNTRPVLKTFAVLTFALLLTACSVFQSHPSPDQPPDDATITTNVRKLFAADAQVNAIQVNVQTSKGVVQLGGFVDTEAHEKRAVALARQAEGVKQVKDNMVVIAKLQGK
ncbi:MAG: BON domain-containing protein [Pseudomonadota bacterium]|nr:BON domain-containing protein [Pseudomonadota bacterium]